MEEDHARQRPNIRELYAAYAAAVVPLIVQDVQGDEHIGSAFHVGDGSFVTAWHVAEGKLSCRVEIDRFRAELPPIERRPGAGIERDHVHEVTPKPSPKTMNDVAVFSIPELRDMPFIPLGDHLDDWIGDDDFVLNEVLVLGFPPIPLSARPILVAARGQLNAVVDLININHVHFIVSVTARGGFSGGVVISEWGFGLGVITSSLVKNGAPEELGYLTVLSVEPILHCLADNLMLPKALAEMWDGLFTETNYHFGKPEEGWAQAFMTTDYDGHRTVLQFACPSDECVADCFACLDTELPMASFSATVEEVEVHRLLFAGDPNVAAGNMDRARKLIADSLIKHGFLPVERPSLIHRSLEKSPAATKGKAALAFSRTKHAPGVSEAVEIDEALINLMSGGLNRSDTEDNK